MEVIERAKKKNEHFKDIGIYEIISLFFTLIFASYNFYLGVFHGVIWNYSVSFYYLLILIAKTISIIVLFKTKKENKEFPQNVFIFVSILLIFVTLTMIIPANIMLKNLREIKVGLWPAIIVLCYTIIRVCYLVHLYKNLNSESSLYYQLKITLNTSATIFCLLTLQNTLIVINGSMSENAGLISTISTNILLFVAFIISLVSLFKGIKRD